MNGKVINMYCNKCGKELMEDNNFCIGCGQKRTEVQQQSKPSNETNTNNKEKSQDVMKLVKDNKTVLIIVAVIAVVAIAIITLTGSREGSNRGTRGNARDTDDGARAVQRIQDELGYMGDRYRQDTTGSNRDRDRQQTTTPPRDTPRPPANNVSDNITPPSTELRNVTVIINVRELTEHNPAWATADNVMIEIASGHGVLISRRVNPNSTSETFVFYTDGRNDTISQWRIRS